MSCRKPWANNALWYSLIGEKGFLPLLMRSRAHLSHGTWMYDTETNEAWPEDSPSHWEPWSHCDLDEISRIPLSNQFNSSSHALGSFCGRHEQLHWFCWHCIAWSDWGSSPKRLCILLPSFFFWSFLITCSNHSILSPSLLVYTRKIYLYTVWTASQDSWT